MRDVCHNFSHSFLGGKSYGIIGECGSGGWALSYVLTGQANFDGKLTINSEVADLKKLQNTGFYVGEGKENSFFSKNKTIKKQILNGIEKEGKYTFEELVQMFELTPSRLDRRIDHVSNERWNASVAIGLAHGKTVFCFPWLNSGWVNLLYQRIEQCIKVLKKQGCVVIIPTSRADTLIGLVDEIIEILHPDEFIKR